MNEKTKATLMLILSMLIFGTIGVFRRAIPLPSGLLACIRGFGGALFLTLFVKLRGGKIFHGTDRRSLLLTALTGGLIGFNWILLFEAFNYTTVSVATLCYYMAPIIVILLSPVFFRERLTGRKLLCTLAALIGMAFVSGVFEGESVLRGNMKGVLLALGAGALYASVIILSKLVRIEDPYEKTVIQLFSAAVILLPYLALTGGFAAPALDTRAAVMLTVVCIVHTGIAYALYFASMKALKGQTVALLSYIDPVSAMLFSVVLLGEPMSVFGIIGAVLIIGAAILAGDG